MSDVAQAHGMMTVAEYRAYADAHPRQRFEPGAVPFAALHDDVALA